MHKRGTTRERHTAVMHSIELGSAAAASASSGEGHVEEAEGGEVGWVEKSTATSARTAAWPARVGVSSLNVRVREGWLDKGQLVRQARYHQQHPQQLLFAKHSTHGDDGGCLVRNRLSGQGE